MTMRLDESTRGVWYCPTVPNEQDFLLTLNRLDDECYEITYRFRYYNSDDPFDEKDKKSWYSGQVKNENEQEVISGIHHMMQMLSIASGNEFVELLRGDRPFEEFMDEFMEQDFVHAQKVH